MVARLVCILFVLALVSAAPQQKEPATIFLAGDSTMAEKREDRRPETGWGEAFAHLVDTTRFRVANHARNGRSTRSFIEEGRWSALVDALTEGDYVFIQFGHNDASEGKPDRYTPPDDYRANLVSFVAATRARGAVPVLLTPVVRRRFDENGHFFDSHGAYPDIVRDVARSHDVALIDMEEMSREVVVGYGETQSRRLFLHLTPGEHANYPQGLEDDTHFSPLGARVIAGLARDAFVALLSEAHAE